ncbi:beta-N-acetylhexosaminidase family protein [Krasilnikoviella flava]|uniref:Hyaluronoglucosaminidase n=1 Tax=Krasilnikoviella flava TaxID=526729 RepID=A0A1T5M364_9MICO|nr:beta-N-acetylglucosaminidase domain-containing protein [Krasilnikoviella flava]SKC82603.1 hyaluronoglucosaminidase [Krasilnikoviella flava]
MTTVRRRLAAGTLTVATLLATGATGATAASASPAHDDLPTVSPAPQEMRRTGHDLRLSRTVEVVVDDDTDAAAQDALTETLREHGVRAVARDADDRARAGGQVRVLLGDGARSDIRAALGRVAVPDHDEAYALRVDTERGRGTVTLAGHDTAGQFYAVQTLEQLLVDGRGGTGVAGATVQDFPAMPLRGTIEGFYGEPWTHDERLDQLAFYGDVKANTYVYAPKDDPYHREKWREDYPADKLAELAELVEAATANHVRFTFALSPGNSICYSSEDDMAALERKFQALYDVGVRAFSVPLDDIDYSRWACESDRAAYGDPSPGSAGKAQADFLTRVQQGWIEEHDGARPLQMVPTEYYNTTESPYKAALREMDDDVVVMWTGNDVVPQSISVDQAIEADTVFGGPTFLWDNYPVNDYGQTSGRLLLAPYDKREPGLSDHLAGIVSNPMNQAAASKVAVFGIADFAWNDRGYDRDRSWVEAMRYLAGDDRAATRALLAFGDLNHLAPSFGDPWQPQAPALAADVDAFWRQWEAGHGRAAVDGLRDRADLIAAVPETLRRAGVDPAFVSDAAPWLDATDLWGDALLATLDAAEADLDGDTDARDALLAEARASAEAAAQVIVDPPDNRWGAAPVQLGDGVLDTFLTSLGSDLSS